MVLGELVSVATEVEPGHVFSFYEAGLLQISPLNHSAKDLDRLILGWSGGGQIGLVREIDKVARKREMLQTLRGYEPEIAITLSQ